MGPLQVIFGGVVTILFYGMILIGLFKLFRIHNDVGEVKKMLTELKIHSDSLAVISAAQSSENVYADTPKS